MPDPDVCIFHRFQKRILACSLVIFLSSCTVLPERSKEYSKQTWFANSQMNFKSYWINGSCLMNVVTSLNDGV